MPIKNNFLQQFFAPAHQAVLTAARDSAMRELRPAYDRYVAEVSEADMAASLETMGLVLALCRGLEPARVADLGSGFSSYVLRLWAGDSGARVYSVDDNPAWLAKTRDFLAADGLEADRLMTWEAFQALPREEPAGLDLVFHDLGDMATRRAAFDWILAKAPGVPVLVDDVHKRKGEHFFQAARTAGRELLPLKDLTLDRFGRFSALLLD